MGIYILVQERCKPSDCEEDGLELIEMQVEKVTVTCECNGYKVVNFNPFYS
jgi:hypothetical protein